MPDEQIKDSDSVSRSIYHPKDYTLDNIGVLDLRKGYVFQQRDNYCESVNCNRLLGNDIEKIHALGVRKQNQDNEKLKKEGRQRIYTGYVSAGVGKIRNDAKAEDVHFNVVYSPIMEPPANKNLAHCDVKLLFAGTKPNSARKTLALARFCDCFGEQIKFSSV